MIDRKHCNGCRDNFYNGNNEYGVKECWNLKNSKLVMRKQVHINQVPPWRQRARKFPDCYRVSQFVFVTEERT